MSSSSVGAAEWSRSARFALNFTHWNPSAEEWSECCSRVELEEITRIQRFVYKKDAKAALAGRLILRHFLTDVLQVKNSSLVFGRGEKGKPFLQSPPQSEHVWDFNLSHSGDFVVLGAEQDALIGIDIMKTDFPRGKNLADYFKLMSSQFSSREWNLIRAPANDTDKLRNFYRLWCLKESYVKALGVGIGYNVSRLDFDLPDKTLVSPESCRHISLSIDSTIQPHWSFTEFVVDEHHVGAVAVQAQAQLTQRERTPEMVFLTMDEIVAKLEPLAESDPELGARFCSKLERPS
ncbi:putative L-aminoadipate-semialdehyde dehydrogenase-phosphopantetheinyl transferase [Hypsibius exemplaris]|uniref:L-aminoadipate-semialdehyde dehydrogenase-phosphopantetheinyl transferase n=1 Tax=Hypsibius exemplaris TaxID=2072580 RepID=A0A1W0W9B0_HYPEX|nr:putative L-aminoadipate-semialdehyde dehydrogenase-phosphopantetheinyl transferase [Hypsibius exemplaris]